MGFGYVLIEDYLVVNFVFIVKFGILGLFKFIDILEI